MSFRKRRKLSNDEINDHKLLQKCKEDPFRFLEHLEEIEGFKLRVGDYRLIIDVDKTTQTMHIMKAGHRKNIYEN